jgi:hypothetical protein
VINQRSEFRELFAQLRVLCDAGHTQGTSHHARDIEKGEHSLRIAHSGQEQAKPEQSTRDQCRYERQRSAPCRTRNTVPAASIMKLNVAINDRGERLASPHTPWPLVQPEPQRVPKPTSNPDSPSTGRPCGKSMVSE